MRRLGACVVMAALLIGSALAETIVLQGGKNVDGKILRTNDVGIVIQTKTGVQTYRFDELQSQAQQQAAAEGAAITNTPVRPPATGGESIHLGRGFASFILTIRAGQLLWILGSIFLLVQGFRTSILWGIVLLLTNFLGGIVFVILHPRRAALPVLIMLAGIVIFATAPLWGMWGATVR
jgi:hypothetical protein